MVSIPCSSSAACCLPNSPSISHRPPFTSRLSVIRPLPWSASPHCRRCQASISRLTIWSKYEIDPSSSSDLQLQQQSPNQQIRTLFPGGFKRPEIKVPTVVLRVVPTQVLENERLMKSLDNALSNGIVGIVLLSADSEDGGGGRLYDAACSLRSLIRDRAYLIIDERVDIAAAVGASGVLLSDQGLPAIVAKNMMMKSTPESVMLPLVARRVKNRNDAVTACNSEGVDFLMLDYTENSDKVLAMTAMDVKVPTFQIMDDFTNQRSPSDEISKFLQSGASGIVITVDDIELLPNDVLKKVFYNANRGRSPDLDDNSKPKNSEPVIRKKSQHQNTLVAGFTKLADRDLQLLEEEKDILLQTVSVIRKAAPTMEEASLLVDAITRLDQPFLLAVVGEFNSGKSSFINALLGRKCLKDGVVPTTNEITLLCYSDTEGVEQEQCERHPDGQFICYLSSPILQNMNLVDTPGTNVILKRQQRLTEEFVPRADLVLFVLSSDRPLTESEVEFLLYIQQWKKKVMFVLNKADLYQNSSELEEAVNFVKKNVGKLLNTRNVILFPVSARLALEAKISALSDTEQNFDGHLANDLRWRSSGFTELENFLFSFLDGSTDAGQERMRLKLETPIAIATRLLAVTEKLTKQEYEQACKELVSINDLVDSVREYGVKMEMDSITWRQKIETLIEATKSRMLKLFESIVQLSNTDLLTTYTIKGDKSTSVYATAAVQNEILTPSISEMQRMLGEYFQWLESSISEKGQLYKAFFDKRHPSLISVEDQYRQDTGLLLQTRQSKRSLQVAENFSASAAARLFEQEIREVALVTYGGMGAAGLSASLLTSVLPTTLEDLLALAFCSSGGLLAISSFPVRRKKALEKIQRVADRLSKEIEEAMKGDLLERIQDLESSLKTRAKPYKEAAQHKIERLTKIQKDVALVEEKLQLVRNEIQNIKSS